ncbi:MAG: hypothetical protein HIU81_13240 [Acidobacteria bacterium]|nr:hypothetical protein [Acidobacteriota bacterium]
MPCSRPVHRDALAELEAFIALHGHRPTGSKNVPTPEYNLAMVMYARRRDLNAGLLDVFTAKRVRAVLAARTRNDWVWEQNYRAAVAGKPVGTWIRSQRQRLRDGTLSAGRIELLSALPQFAAEPNRMAA